MITKSVVSPRDRGLLSLMYLAALRVSEVISLRKHQFEVGQYSVHVSRINVLKKRKVVLRDFDLPLSGERAPLTELVLSHLKEVAEPTDLVFNMTRQTAYRIAKRTGKWDHWFRAQGEQFLYSKTKDVIAVANKLKIHPRTLPIYVHDLEREVPII